MKRSKRKCQKEIKLIKSREGRFLLCIGSIIGTVATTLRGYYARWRRRLKRIRPLVNGGRWYGTEYQLGRSRAQLIRGIWKNLRRNLMNSLQRWEYVPQRKPKDSHQSMVYLLHIRNSLSVFYPKKMSLNFELLPLSRSVGLYSYFLQIKHPGKINDKWQ